MDDLVAGVRAGDRTSMGRAITLVESTRPEDRRQAQALLAELLPHAGGAHRVGISGVPGAGKSTLIDSLGIRLTRAGHRVGVLAVDPSSMVTGGSILGDKTRMATLAADENAFIRPSPSAGTLGGVTSTTPHAITVLEAAGYDVVLVETMGVGQSEAAVHASVDCLCVLVLAGAGDELQTVKRGLLELADVLAVNKADGDNEQAARLAAAEFRRALPLLAPTSGEGPPPVMAVSAVTGAGVDELWDRIVEHRRTLEASGALAARRARGRLAWMRVLLERRLVERFDSQPGLADRRAELEHAVEQGQITPEAAVDQLLSAS
ncbi:MAG: methylmalonyl Co-A mutase-associated GTPase MeaB [Acidimicrobiaceae bacterium]|nr:methylmalonyl Co-A mutase-associated GTPase MeaB [Acidimicrobiaceae bacterium]MYE10004.1 methylmalonyl Co-A mutase-associated GTPase MeaB [Acidimicrobiaceae bacterium]MYI36497.1 methylmalonyl Co-A mutase-associated GTPase MeaB [Acidimicrobiaceae bacterium]